MKGDIPTQGRYVNFKHIIRTSNPFLRLAVGKLKARRVDFTIVYVNDRHPSLGIEAILYDKEIDEGTEAAVLKLLKSAEILR